MKHNKTISIPIGCNEGSLLLKLDEENDKNILINLKDFLTLNFDCKEINIGDKYFLLRVANDSTNLFKKIIYIEPPFRFRNCFPKTMFI